MKLEKRGMSKSLQKNENASLGETAERGNNYLQ